MEIDRWIWLTKIALELYNIRQLYGIAWRMLILHALGGVKF